MGIITIYADAQAPARAPTRASAHANAHAKINLTLTLTGRRQDGYHLMESLVVFADLADRITMTPLDQGQDTLTITGTQADGLNTIDRADNLLIKAMTLYRDQTGWRPSFSINLEKNIPIAAGIGGGSSDAAAVLTALNRLNPNPCSDDELAAIGLRLGADLPVCLKQFHGPYWRMQGIGEILDPLHFSDLNQAGLILINPMIGIATKDVFHHLSTQAFTPPGDDFMDADLAAWLDRGNDMTAAAEIIEPQVSHCLRLLEALNDQAGFRHHGMSGSGATCYALFDHVDQAKAAYPVIKDQIAWSWVGKILNQHDID